MKKNNKIKNNEDYPANVLNDLSVDAKDLLNMGENGRHIIMDNLVKVMNTQLFTDYERLVFVDYYWRGYSVKTITETSSTTTSKVNTTRKNILEKLQKQIDNITGLDKIKSTYDEYCEKLKELEQQINTKESELNRLIEKKGFISTDYTDVIDSIATEMDLLKMKLKEEVKNIDSLSSDLASISQSYAKFSKGLNTKVNAPVPYDIRGLDLSTRAFNILVRAGISKITHLKKMTVSDLRKIRNCGEGTVKEILKKLEEYGIYLKEE